MNLSSEVRELLGPEGALARRLEGYEKRPEQERLATAIADCLEQDRTLVAEAGTGIGKSFAYLLPAILWSEASGKRVIVSTRTKALQEQLDRKDLPLLKAVLPIEFSWVVAMGRSNYLCLRRMHLAIQDRKGLFRDPEQLGQLQKILEWSGSRGIDGLRSELSFVPSGTLWSEVQAEQGNCLGKQCRHYAPCHWQRGRRRMRAARILVVNHALYFSDLALRVDGHAYLPDHDLVVFDEAQHLENIASEALGLRFGPAQIEWHLARLLNREGTRGLLVRAGMAGTAPLIGSLRARAADYWAGPEAAFRERSPGGTPLRLPADRRFEDSLSGPLRELAETLREAAPGATEDHGMELNARADQLDVHADLARAFAAGPNENEVRWIERERRQLVLRAAPVRVSSLLAEALFRRIPRSVLVSATLGPPEKGFAWIRSRLGVENGRSLRLGSPFPYEENVKLDIREGLPDPVTKTRDFETAANSVIRDLCLENRGRALVLFTSWRFLRTCAGVLAPAMEEESIELLVQGEQPLGRLIARKRSVPESVLLGTDSLWEGIDIPGDALTLLILTRFPFPVPSHPLTAARIEELERRGLGGFSHYSLPQATLKFCQGFGRLVRRADDKGRVVILDPRTRLKSYGRVFLDAIPRCDTA